MGFARLQILIANLALFAKIRIFRKSARTYQSHHFSGKSHWLTIGLARLQILIANLDLFVKIRFFRKPASLQCFLILSSTLQYHTATCQPPQRNPNRFIATLGDDEGGDGDGDDHGDDGGKGATEGKEERTSISIHRTSQSHVHAALTNIEYSIHYARSYDRIIISSQYHIILLSYYHIMI